MNGVIFLIGVAVGSVVVVGVQLLFAGLKSNEITLSDSWDRPGLSNKQRWGEDRGRK